MLRLLLLFTAFAFSASAQGFIVDGPVSTSQVTATNAAISNLSAGNVSATGGVSVTGNVSANKFIGDGSLLTGISGGGGGGTGTIASGTATALAYYTSTTTLSAAPEVSYTTGTRALSAPSLTLAGTLTGASLVSTSTGGTVSGTNGDFQNISGTTLKLVGNAVMAAVSASNVSASGNVSAVKFLGDGSSLSGVSPTAIDAGIVVGTVTNSVSSSLVSATVIDARTVSLTNLTITGTCTGCGAPSATSIDAGILVGTVRNDVSASTVSATAVNALNVSATNLYPVLISQTSGAGVANAARFTTVAVTSATLIGSSTVIADAFGPPMAQIVGANGTNILKIANANDTQEFNIYLDNTLTDAPIALGSKANSSWAITTNNGTNLVTFDKGGGLALGTYGAYTGSYVAPCAGCAIIPGKIGVGTTGPNTELDVRGTISTTNITIAPNAGTCNSTNKGMLRFGSVSNTLQFCTGTKWQSLSPTTT